MDDKQMDKLVASYHKYRERVGLPRASEEEAQAAVKEAMAVPFHKHLLALLAVLVLGAFVYWAFFSGPEPEPDPARADALRAERAAATRAAADRSAAATRAAVEREENRARREAEHAARVADARARREAERAARRPAAETFIGTLTEATWRDIAGQVLPLEQFANRLPSSLAPVGRDGDIRMFHHVFNDRSILLVLARPCGDRSGLCIVAVSAR